MTWRRHLLGPATLIAAWLLAAGHATAHDLTFEDRVRCQEAIERVRYAHQLGTTATFEEAVSREVLERKVGMTLRKSVALEVMWHTRVTPEMMTAEVERMLRSSRMPTRLRELFGALGDDPVLIRECLARPVVVDRLSRHFFAHDREIHAESRRRATELQRQLALGSLDVSIASAGGSTVTLVRGLSRATPAIRVSMDDDAAPSSPAPDTLELQEDRFDQLRSRFGSDGSRVALLETENQFVVAVLVDQTGSTMRVATYVVEKSTWSNWWQTDGLLDWDDTANGGWAEARTATEDAPAQRDTSPSVLGAPPAVAHAASVGPACASDDSWENGSLDDPFSPRSGFTTTWTGNDMIVWGGTDGRQPFGDGRRYEPATDTWSSTSITDAPGPRWLHSATWTGQEMVIWGGTSNGSNAIYTGARYDPLTDSWEPLSEIEAPAGRYGHTTIWTGRWMIVWGGHGAFGPVLNTGARYDPQLDEWTPMTPTGSPSPRAEHSAVWTGAEMVVWGGGDAVNGFSRRTGGRYDPVLDRWSMTTTDGAPTARTGHTAVWTGQEMIVWGGDVLERRGGRYDPQSDTWKPISNDANSVGTYQHSAVWTGRRMLVWGGFDINSGLAVDAGWDYDPDRDQWARTSSFNAPTPRHAHAAIWTGQLMLVWGGQEAVVHPGVAVSVLVTSGGRYDPAADAWTPISDEGVPRGRIGHSSVWTGNEMIVWGGAFTQWAFFSLRSGGRYDPVIDDWTPTTVHNAPSARQVHSAVWTGREMIVWGGYDVLQTNTGGRYDPTTDTWTPTSLVAAPAQRAGHLALWIGDSMFIWGGYNGNDLNSGARYDPSLDRWSPTAVVGAPVPRTLAKGVWTGSEVVVWGGFRSTIGDTNTGGRYDSRLNVWRTVSTTGSPTARGDHAVVWTGSEMIVWGGAQTNTGGRYDPTVDTWRPTSTLNAPTGRSVHTAIWTGQSMIVWGGFRQFDYLSSGGRYDPSADRWSPTAMSWSPSGRSHHTAVWTGTRMIVWGGWNAATIYNTGGQYCVCTEARYYLDSDGDGHGGAESAEFCDPPVGYVTTSDDCDDGDARVYPESVESCNGIDDDCDGEVDQGFGIGASCRERMDECHEVVGTFVCSPDGTGSRCDGATMLHDTTPPVLVCPANDSVECPATVESAGSATATDACDSDPAIARDASGSLPLGSTTITWVATDASGNSASCEQSILVRDTNPPRLTLFSDPASLWPPNHEMVPVHVAWQVQDACDAHPRVEMSSVSSSEADDAASRGDGDTVGDIQGVEPGTPDSELLLRAERDGSGPGRVYELTYQAVDASGNAMPALTVVTVPHDLGAGLEPLLMRLAPDPASGYLRVLWAGLPDAVGYDVIAGDLSQVRVDNHALSLGNVRVLAQDTRETSLLEVGATIMPPPGSGIFYLIQARTESGGRGYGTESAPWPRIPASCDGGCP